MLQRATHVTHNIKTEDRGDCLCAIVGVCTENLNADVMVMKTAEQGV